MVPKNPRRHPRVLSVLEDAYSGIWAALDHRRLLKEPLSHSIMSFMFKVHLNTCPVY